VPSQIEFLSSVNVSLVNAENTPYPDDRYRYLAALQYFQRRDETSSVDITNKIIADRASSTAIATNQNLRVYIRTLVASGKGFTNTELACTVSHLLTISRICSSEVSFALVLEDDMKFLYHLDVESLVASAPKDFSILQLRTNDFRKMSRNWASYVSSGELWARETSWSAGAYLVNVKVVRPIINRIVHYTTDGNMIADLVSVYKEEMCGSHTPYLDCVVSPDGSLIADYFIYALKKSGSYLLTLPLLDRLKPNGSAAFKSDVQFHSAMDLIYPLVENLTAQAIHQFETGATRKPLFLKDVIHYN
jgi:GR25 family glycosyltransferase involved in LPS biosynthesis